jgi:hypothetical protein
MRFARSIVYCGAALAAGAAALLAQTGPAAAHSRTFIGLNFGFGYAPWPYYYRPYHYPSYYYPPYYYYPPPVVYAPPPVVYAQPAPMVVNPASAPYVARNGQTCREYQSTAVIGGAVRPVHGTACLQPDGAWRIVN